VLEKGRDRLAKPALPGVGRACVATETALAYQGVNRFSYGITFEVQEDRILVIACLHGKRNLKRWQSR